MSVPDPTRRHLLLGGLAMAAAASVAACGGHRSAHTTQPPTSSGASPYVGETRFLALAAALENQAVGACRQVAAALREGAYARPSAALAAQVALAGRDHQEHADAWNALLTAAGLPAVTGVPLASAAMTTAALSAAGTPAAAATLLLPMEQALAATWLDAADGPGFRLAARSAPVEAAHVAVLSVLLGRPAAAGSFLTTSGAVRTSALTV